MFFIAMPASVGMLWQEKYIVIYMRFFKSIFVNTLKLYSVQLSITVMKKKKKENKKVSHSD